MIKSLQNALVKELNAEFYKRNRRYMDTYLDSKMTIKASRIQGLLINDLCKIIDTMNKKSEALKLQKNAPAAKRYRRRANEETISNRKLSTARGAQSMVGQPLLTGGVGQPVYQSTQVGRTSIPIDKKLMKIAVKYAYPRHFTPTKYKAEFKKNLNAHKTPGQRRTPSSKFLSDFKRFAFIFKGSSIEIKFGGAEIGDGKLEPGDLALKHVNHQRVVDYTNITLMRATFATFRNKYLKLLMKSRKDNISNEFEALADATGVGIGYQKTRAPAKTHGETKTGLLNRGAAVAAKDPKTGTVATVAVTGLARESDTIFKNMKSSYKPAGNNLSGSELDIVLEETKNLLTRNYKLDHLRDGTKKESATIGGKQVQVNKISRKFEVKLELDGPQAAMEKYDVRGIKKHLEEHDKQLVKLIEKRLGRELAKTEGSNSLQEDVALLGQTLVPKAFLTKKGKLDRRKVKTTKSGGLDMRFEENKKLMAQWQKTGAIKKKETAKFSPDLRKTKTTRTGSAKQVTSTSIVAMKARSSRQKRGHVQEVIGQSPLALANLINKALPKAVKSNMGVPALVNRTGRFAESAEVQNVTMGPRGGTVVEYTYQKNPYQTFEPGFAQGSTYRDPRRTIGESVREIAQGMLSNKFIRTRRV